MATTIWTLEDRVELMADDVASLKTKVEVTAQTVATIQAQVTGLVITVNAIQQELTSFKSRVETVLSMVKWLGGIAAAFLVTGSLQLFWVATRYGEVNNSVVTLQKTVEKQEQASEEQSKLLREIATDLAAVKARLKP